LKWMHKARRDEHGAMKKLSKRLSERNPQKGG
jgi:hypothetical protein